MYALFASSFSVGKVLLSYAQPIFITGTRMLVGGSILLAYQYWGAREGFRIVWKHRWLYLQMILFGIYITYILRFWALNYLPSSKTCFLYNLSPFLSSLYLYLLFGERMSKRQWVGLIIGFLGLIPILIATTPQEELFGEFLFVSWPELVILLSVATHSYSWIVMRKMVRYKSYSPIMINGLSMACGGLLALITSLIVEGTPPLITDVAPFVGWLMFVVIVSNIICYNMYGSLLKRYSPTFLSFAGFLAPIFAGFYGWAFLNETITWHFYVSNIIVFIGLYIFYQEELKQQPFVE